jgi:hypothetical protein
MLKMLMKLAAASLLATTASMAVAAPSTNLQSTRGVENDIVRVHGRHRSCERGPGGWHRHNHYGERRHCREWRGEGRRPDFCVRVGRAFYCDY